MIRFWKICLIFTSLGALMGCSVPLISKKDQVEIPCRYREVFSVARVDRVEGSAVTFEITGYRTHVVERKDLPDRFTFEEGDEFNVRQRFLVRGKCEPYLFEVLRSR
jgi:hypothetical protein